MGRPTSIWRVFISNNAFKITPDGTITQIIDSTGDGTHSLELCSRMTVHGPGDVYVVGGSSDNAFKITPGGAITQIIDGTGDGTNSLDSPHDVAVDGSGNVYVTGSSSDNAFKITPGGAITQIIDSTGDGTHSLVGPTAIAVDGSANVYLTGHASDNAFRIQLAPSVCGNGILEAGEECDDGNTPDGDGRSSACAVEDGWWCTGEPSLCAERINLVMNPNFELDNDIDGNPDCWALILNYPNDYYLDNQEQVFGETSLKMETYCYPSTPELPYTDGFGGAVQWFNVEPNTTYTVSYCVKTDTPDNVRALPNSWEFDAEGNGLGQHYSYFPFHQGGKGLSLPLQPIPPQLK